MNISMMVCTDASQSGSLCLAVTSWQQGVAQVVRVVMSMGTDASMQTKRSD